MLEIRVSREKLPLTRQNMWKMAIVNKGDKKAVLNYIKAQKLLASPTDGLKTYLRFFPTVKWMGREGVQMSAINITNHNSVL